MSLALGNRQGCGDVIDVGEAAPPQINRLGAIRRRAPRLVHLGQPPPQGLVDELLQRLAERVPELFDPRRNIVIERERRSHASKHIEDDALMSMCLIQLVMPLHHGFNAAKSISRDAIAEPISEAKRDLIGALPKIRRAGRTDASDLFDSMNARMSLSFPFEP